MKRKNKTLFIAGIAVACVAYAVKNSKTEDKLLRNVSSIAIPLGLVVSTIAYLSNVD